MSTNKQHKFLTEFAQHIQMGNEIGPSEIEPHQIYSIYYVVSAKHAEKYQSRSQQQWGIVMTDNQGTITRTYNLSKMDAWETVDSFNLTNSHHIFRACWKDAYFAEEAVLRLNAESRWKRICEHADRQREEYMKFRSHWLVRLVSRFIPHTNGF